MGDARIEHDMKDQKVGGVTVAMKLTKMFIENGAPGVHIEDQQIQKVVVAQRDYLQERCCACIGGTSVRDDID